MPKYKMKDLCQDIRKAGDDFGFYVSGEYARKLAARYLSDQEVAEDLESNGLQHNPLTYSDKTGEKAVHAWFAALINQELEQAA